MKLVALAAVLLMAAPEAAVKFEADGVRVGAELVAGKALSLKAAAEAPILVSGSAVENLSAAGRALPVALSADRSVLLDVGIRLARTAEGFQLSTHGPALALEAGGRTLSAEGQASFKLTDAGFDFGPAGKLEGPSFAARVVAAQNPPTPGQQPGQQPPQPPGRRRVSQTQRVNLILVRIFSGLDPGVTAQFADGTSIRQLIHVSPTGTP